MTKQRSTRRKATKFSGSAKITLTALSLLGFVGSWNLIGRLENPAVQAQSPLPSTTPPPAASQPSPTAWPTIAPLADIPPIPTLAPFDTGQPAALPADNPVFAAAPELQPAAPLPTLAPLPPMPEMPSLPAPPPPPPPVPAGGWQNSGGS